MKNKKILVLCAVIIIAITVLTLAFSTLSKGDHPDNTTYASAQNDNTVAVFNSSVGEQISDVEGTSKVSNENSSQKQEQSTSDTVENSQAKNENSTKENKADSTSVSNTETSGELPTETDSTAVTQESTTKIEVSSTSNPEATESVIETTTQQTEVKEPTFIVETVDAKAGQKQVAVKIEIKNNPNIASIGMNVGFGSALTLTKIVYNEEIGGQSILPENYVSPTKLIWVSPFENCEGDKTLATLYFDVSKKAVGMLPITIAYNADDVYDMSEKNLDFEIVNGGIKIK